jgi:hypothetical protein
MDPVAERAERYRGSFVYQGFLMKYFKWFEDDNKTEARTCPLLPYPHPSSLPRLSHAPTTGPDSRLVLGTQNESQRDNKEI